MTCKECGNNQFYTQYPEVLRKCSQCGDVTSFDKKKVKKEKSLFGSIDKEIYDKGEINNGI